MSRSGYSDDYDTWSLIRWRGAVNSAIKGKRGQSFLREMIAALDALPAPRLIAEELQEGGDVCAIGSVGLRRGVPMTDINVENPRQVAEAFGIAKALVQEIEFINDEGEWNDRHETPERRFERVRAWVVAQLAADKASESQS